MSSMRSITFALGGFRLRRRGSSMLLLVRSAPPHKTRCSAIGIPPLAKLVPDLLEGIAGEAVGPLARQFPFRLSIPVPVACVLLQNPRGLTAVQVQVPAERAVL